MQGFTAGITTNYDCTYHIYFIIDGHGIIRYRGAFDDVTIRATLDTAISQLSISAVGEVPAAGHRLQANYPNPFNPRTVIPFDLAPGDGDVNVRLEILDLRGRVVATVLDGLRSRGRRHTATWDGTDRAGRRLPSGVYLARLRVDGFSQARSITIVK